MLPKQIGSNNEAALTELELICSENLNDAAGVRSRALDLLGKLRGASALNPERPLNYVASESPLEHAAKRAAESRATAIERAVTGWAEQAGVTVEAWMKIYGYTVETTFQGLSVSFVVKPVFGRPGQEVVFPQSVRTLPEQ